MSIFPLIPLMKTIKSWNYMIKTSYENSNKEDPYIRDNNPKEDECCLPVSKVRSLITIFLASFYILSMLIALFPINYAIQIITLFISIRY